jgi:hypothetical protein
MEARAKLIDLAAFLDRVDRAPGKDDFRMAAFRNALQNCPKASPHRAKRVLLSLSDPTTEPAGCSHHQSRCRRLAGFKIQQGLRYALHRTSRPHGQPHDG